VLLGVPVGSNSGDAKGGSLVRRNKKKEELDLGDLWEVLQCATTSS
jgi:hypothetical protein